ncbi:hypothetical protein ANCDUO_04735 [Ancylostoma duodenale]|uniref:Core-2/I-Branching enzyme n=1 Tax=Ancylostoma duodenale TaxID=51022 RepID=A0A0C2H6A7_9BILA|nr:hypothetical protein ANCDUO_04735 [Ancylostoma duodenale]
MTNNENHDVIIKSPYEVATIFELLEGANDVEITPCPKDRLDLTEMWDARSLKLFANDIDMSESAVSAKQLNATLSFAKGAVQVSLSRAAVEWLVFTANLTTLMQQINKMMLPEFDYAIVECVHEMIFNRTFLEQVDHPLDMDYYSNMVNVKFHKNRKRPDPSYTLDCRPKTIGWQGYPYP